MNLHARVAQALDCGWTEADARSFSLPALREVVRHVSPKLADEITRVMNGTPLLCAYCDAASEYDWDGQPLCSMHWHEKAVG